MCHDLLQIAMTNALALFTCAPAPACIQASLYFNWKFQLYFTYFGSGELFGSFSTEQIEVVLHSRSLPGDVVVQITHYKSKVTMNQQLQLDTESRQGGLPSCGPTLVFPNMCPNPPGLPHLPPSRSYTSQQRATPLPHFSLLHRKKQTQRGPSSQNYRQEGGKRPAKLSSPIRLPPSHLNRAQTVQENLC